METIGNRVGVWTRQPPKEKREEGNRPWPVEMFSLTANRVPAICNMGVGKSVADRANALSEVE